MKKQNVLKTIKFNKEQQIKRFEITQIIFKISEKFYGKQIKK
jgi:hypothetical protein